MRQNARTCTDRATNPHHSRPTATFSERRTELSGRLGSVRVLIEFTHMTVALAAIIHHGRIFAWGRAARGVHDLHAQPEFSPQG